MSEHRYPMHTLPAARRSLQQVFRERRHDLISEQTFALVHAKLVARIAELLRRDE